MRRILLALLLALLLAVPVALARGGHDDEAGDDDDHETDRAERSAHASATREERRAAREAAVENRSAAFASFKENMTKLRESWLTDAAAIREACHAAERDANATKEDKLDAAHCVRDGYKSWRELHRDDFRALKDAFRDLMRGFGRGSHS